MFGGPGNNPYGPAKVLMILSVVAVIIAGLDYLSILEAPLQLGANSWILVAIVLGVWGNGAKQWKSQKET